ncbi:MAG: SPOR domain-containing protein [Bacteroidia bacterium]|nr:SPOR domain-containing protein [Bacteroidia bacterium]MDW8333047.1 SPOR domain-containing protein [Bacteroidia bacterium]
MWLVVWLTSCAWIWAQSMPDLSAYRYRVRPSVALDLPPRIEADAGARLTVKAEPDSALRAQLERFRQRFRSRTADERQGWRVQIYSGNGAGANNARFDFLAKYPEVEVYSFYDRPYYKVRVGNFKSQNEAQIFCDKIKPFFPAAFVIPDKIAE